MILVAYTATDVADAAGIVVRTDNNNDQQLHSPAGGGEDDRGGGKAAKATQDITRRMICGGLAGMIAKTITNPLDRIRMLAQTGEHGVIGGSKGGGVTGAAGGSSGRGANVESIYKLFRNTLRNEGVLGLWAGNGANLLRVFPAKAVVFSSQDFYNHGISQIINASSKSTTSDMSGIVGFLAGGFAGVTATACTYPLDFVRGRIAGKLAADGQMKVYSGVWQTLVLTVKDEGLLALYKGATPTLLGAMPYEGIKFGTVGVLELAFPLQEQDGKPTVTRKMLFGGLGGVTAALITYPNDTVRRLLQLQGSRGTNAKYEGYWDCVRQTYRQHGGIGRFYRGFTLNVIRMAPNTAVQFGSYEFLKQLTSNW